MDQERRVKGITDWRPVEVSRNGRERLIWEGDVIVDLGKIKIQNWRKISMDRVAWKRIVEQAKTYKEL